MRHIEKNQKGTILIMGTIGILIILCFAHMSNWGRHSGKILFLKAASLTGMASESTYGQLATACIETGRYDCARDAYLYLFQENRNPEVVAQLAQLYLKTKDYKAASDTFVKYYQLGGNNPNHAYFYGWALEQIGETQRAINAYRLSIEQNPQMLSINATKSLIKLLLQTSRGQEAYDLLAQLLESTENAKFYLNDEMKLLAQYQPAASAPSRPIIQRELASTKAQKPVVKF